MLLRVLFERGCADTAFHLLTAKGYPSFDHWRECGATTLWENWAGRDCSHAHQMFGGVTRYLFQYLLGIRQEETGHYLVSPCLVEGLRHVRGHITTPDGVIAVSIDRAGGNPRVQVRADAGVDVRVVLEGKEYPILSRCQTICL